MTVKVLVVPGQLEKGVEGKVYLPWVNFAVVRQGHHLPTWPLA